MTILGDKVRRGIMRDDLILPPPPPLATGGDSISRVGDWIVHSFTRDGVFEVLVDSLEVEYLVVAGGGGGGGVTNISSYQNRAGGGGGAGGLLYGITTVNEPAIVIVGKGGKGAPDYSTESENGEASRFGAVVAVGGGGTYSSDGGKTGGSGGGGKARSNGGSGSGASGTLGQGNRGGRGRHAASYSSVAGGGGGGAGQEGEDAIPGLHAIPGDGGDGFSCDISGKPEYYAGGGGGGWGGHLILSPGLGGNGGGGDGGSEESGNRGRDGVDGTGGGGGGASCLNGFYGDHIPGGNGGSGIVIVRYKSDASPVKMWRLGGPAFYSVTGGLARFDARHLQKSYYAGRPISELLDRGGQDNNGISVPGYESATFEKNSRRLLTPAIRFDSSAIALPDALKLTPQTAWTRYTVLMLDHVSQTIYSWGHSSNSSTAYQFRVATTSSGQRPYFRIGGVESSGPILDLISSPVIVAATNDGTIGRLWVDGIEVIEVASGTGTPHTTRPPYLGASSSGSNPGFPADRMSGYVFDDITYLGAHDEETRTMIEGNLRTEWSFIFEP